MAMINFTIVIPHKNIPELLVRCLNSIPIRDDVQVIVVDDNSDDTDTYFEKFPELLRPNVELYLTKEGKGAGYARNIGLEHSKGEWLLFADSDDMFTEYFDEILDEILKDKDSDILYFDVESRDSVTMQRTDESLWFSNQIKNIAECGVTDSTKYSLLTPWAKAVRRSMIELNGIRFEEVPCSNDTAFSAKTAFYAKNVSVILKPGYCWMRREGSLWRKKDLTWYVVRMYVSARLAQFMKMHNDYIGQQQFTNNALNFMEGIGNVSRLNHLKYLLWYGWYMHDYEKIYKRFPILVMHYAKESLGIKRSFLSSETRQRPSVPREE